jgi:hypothetical protein
MIRKRTVEELIDFLIEEKGFRKPITTAMKIVNKHVANVINAEDEIDRELAIDDLKTAVILHVFGGADPKVVPTKYIRHAQANPITSVFIHKEARHRIKNPVKGIRAYCLECQGNDEAGVRHCPSVNCPLWSFRMGANVFYGRLIDTDTEAELEEDETDGNS